jgi:nucleoside-diphosphate-sugar epimerase
LNKDEYLFSKQGDRHLLGEIEPEFSKQPPLLKRKCRSPEQLQRMKRLIVWGAGELGGCVAESWADKGYPVIGLTRTPQRHPALRAAGVEPRLGSPLGLLRPDDTLLLALPGHANQKMAVDLLAETLPPARVVLLSSTAYYGLASGHVDEATPPGSSQQALNVAAVERAFQVWAGSAGIVVRLGGLYRRGRGPLAALARRGAPRLRPPDKILALIHYDDAATLVEAALHHPSPQQVYLAVTPPCPTRREFYEAACRRLGLNEPEFDQPLGRPPAQYNVTRLRHELLPQPLYQDWQAALELE